MTRERIGVGVVGVGIMGRRHAENAAHSIPGARLAAGFDADRALAASVAGDLDATTCATLDELLARQDVRAVVIASPSRFHAEQAVAALSSGKDVLLEKPMAHSLADCDRIMAAGEPLLFRAVHRDREATHLPASSGVTDMMFESTIHDFDLSRFFLGDEIVAVTTTASVLCHTRDAHGHAPNAAVNAVRFTRGALADIETYWGALYGYDVRSEVVCVAGTAMIGQEPRTRLAVYTPSGAKSNLIAGFLERFGEAYRAELADFVDGARERRAPAVTGRDGRAAVAAALAGVASFKSGRAEPVAG